MNLLNPAEITQQLETRKLEHWQVKGKTIERTFTLKDFKEALAFINRIGEIAESLNHHPDISLSWNKLIFSIFTHSAGGLTRKDFELAEKIDLLFTQNY